MNSIDISAIRPIKVEDLWCIHSYYTMCPFAPDNSGRLLLAGANLERSTGEVLILSKNGEILDRFGENPTHAGFFHTGFWQTWSQDARFVYYQSGSLSSPKIVRRELATGKEKIMDGDMEGAPPTEGSILSGLMGMIYAAGYGDGIYHPEIAPVEFQKRSEHGIFEYNFETFSKRLVLSINEILQIHPDRYKLLKADREMRDRLCDNEGLTLMAYCVRWNPSGTRFLFYFGNHCVDRERGEPKLAYIFTADRQLKEIHMALDLSFGRPGVHWSWHPDGEHLVGYGPDPENDSKMCLAQVRYDGSGYKRISSHSSGGHPSISPTNYNLLVTDTYERPGKVLFIDINNDKIIKSYNLPNNYGEIIPPGRNPFRVCYHPVFTKDGKKILVNTLPDRNSIVCEIDVPEGYE